MVSALGQSQPVVRFSLKNTTRIFLLPDMSEADTWWILRLPDSMVAVCPNVWTTSYSEKRASVLDSMRERHSPISVAEALLLLRFSTCILFRIGDDDPVLQKPR